MNTSACGAGSIRPSRSRASAEVVHGVDRAVLELAAREQMGVADVGDRVGGVGYWPNGCTGAAYGGRRSVVSRLPVNRLRTLNRERERWA